MKASLVQQLLLLGIIITTLAAGETTASRRNTRQAGRCSGGQQCILLSSCPDLLALLNPPTPAGIKRLQGLTCAFDRRNPKVCCDAPTVENPVVSPPKVVAPKLIVPPDPDTSESEPDPDTSESEPPKLLPDHCGGAIGERVYGGEEVRLKSYSWMALLGYRIGGKLKWNCGGSLISERYVVTAAHCADTAFTHGQKILKVRLGEHDTSKKQDCQETNIGQEECAEPVQDFNPEQIIKHPDWNKRFNLSDDIALIRLDRPATFHTFVQPICLPPSGLDIGAFLKDNKGSVRKAEVAGWGKWGELPGRDSSDVRLMVEVPFVPLEKCKPPLDFAPLGKGQLCFGGELGKDSCTGDSGGPVVSTNLDPNSKSLYVLLGVVSYGPRGSCGLENVPAVYTDVSQYRDWIVNNLKP